MSAIQTILTAIFSVIGLPFLAGIGILSALFGVGGCNSANGKPVQLNETLQTLSAGDFQGEIEIMTDGTVGIGTQTMFMLGTPKTFMKANGQVDFSDDKQSVQTIQELDPDSDDATSNPE